MKKLYTLLLLLCSFSLLAQAPEEGSLDDVFSNSPNLTDQQMYDAQNFVHEGKRDRIIKEECKNNKKALDCDESRVNEGVLFGNVEQHLGKGYSMIFGLLPGMTKLSKPVKEGADVKGADGKAAEPKAADKGGKGAEGGKKKNKDEKDDYCLYAAMAYEGISGFMQSSMQKDAENESASINDPQVASLVNLKKTHEARKKTALYQGIAYSAVTACYGYYAAFQGVSSDPKLWIKMGGAALLSTVFYMKSNKHAEAAKAVQNVINTLPDPGDCNPYTSTSCFCSEPSSKEKYPTHYQEVCVPQTASGPAPINMGCGTMVEGKLQFDKECKCKQTNTCFKVALNRVNPNISVGRNFMDQANTGFDLLSSGAYDVARLNNYSTSSQAMIAKMKDKLKPNLPALKLNEDQKKLAEAYKDVLPEALANVAATAPIGDSPVGLGVGSSSMAALEQVPEAPKGPIAKKVDVKYKSGGNGFGVKKESSESGFQMPSLGKKTDSPLGTEVVSFAEKAISQADVSNAPETPIFDIISNRYRRSGWTKLQQQESGVE